METDSPIGLYFKRSSIIKTVFRVERVSAMFSTTGSYYDCFGVSQHEDELHCMKFGISMYLMNMEGVERITKDEFDAQFYRAIQSITEQHQEMK